MSHRSLTVAAVAGLLSMLTACGGETPADAANTTKSEGSKAVLLEDELLEELNEQVRDLPVVEWRGELLTKAPAHDGRRIFKLSGRFAPWSGDSAISMDSAIGGVKQQIDYLVVDDRTYFNSEAWGPSAADCWVDITGDAARTWGLPTELDPTWPLATSRAVRLAGDGVDVAVPAGTVLTGMPRGLFPTVPEAMKGIEAKASITPHGPLLEIEVDVKNMWADVPEDQRATVETKGAGWWAMTIQEDRSGPVAPPKHVFDPLVTPARQCMKA